MLDRRDPRHRGEVVVVIAARHLVGAQLVEVVRVEHLADDPLDHARVVVPPLELVDRAHAAVRQVDAVGPVEVPVVPKYLIRLREVIGPEGSDRRRFDPFGHGWRRRL